MDGEEPPPAAPPSLPTPPAMDLEATKAPAARGALAEAAPGALAVASPGALASASPGALAAAPAGLPDQVGALAVWGY